MKSSVKADLRPLYFNIKNMVLLEIDSIDMLDPEQFFCDKKEQKLEHIPHITSHGAIGRPRAIHVNQQTQMQAVVT